MDIHCNNSNNLLVHEPDSGTSMKLRERNNESLFLPPFSANLYEFADLLIKRGVVNAINLDGGGSNTLVQDGILLNYPSDHW